MGLPAASVTMPVIAGRSSAFAGATAATGPEAGAEVVGVDGGGAAAGSSHPTVRTERSTPATAKIANVFKAIIPRAPYHPDAPWPAAAGRGLYPATWRVASVRGSDILMLRRLLPA